MKRIILMAAAVASFNVFGAVGVTVQANLQDAVKGVVAGSVSYDNLLNNKVSVVVDGGYNHGTELGRAVSDSYATAAANYANNERLAKGFNLGVAGQYYLNSNKENSFFAGAKVSLAKGELRAFTSVTKKENVEKEDDKGVKKMVEEDVTKVTATPRESTVVRATVPVGYQWASEKFVVSSSVEVGARYDVNAKEKALKPHFEANLLSVGMKF